MPELFGMTVSDDVLALNHEHMQPQRQRSARMTPQRTEHDEQADVVAWAQAMEVMHPDLWLLHAIPNGGHRYARTAAILKAEGVKPGVPDLCLPVPRHSYHGLYIEIKRQDGGAGLSSHQREWADRLEEQGYHVAQCNGAEQAIGILRWWLGMESDT